MSVVSNEYNKLFRILTSENDGDPNKLKEIKWALRNGANPNTLHWDYGVSAMHLAAGQGDLTTEILLHFGGDPNVCSSENLTPLHIAASWGDPRTIELLLQWGADMTIQDQDEKTAYDLAVEWGHHECTRLLKNHMVNLVLKDSISAGTASHCGDGLNDSGHSFSAHQSKKEADNLSGYSSTITKKLYDYLEEGQQVVFDATSPNTPLLGLRSSDLASVKNNSDKYTPSPTPEKNMHEQEHFELPHGRLSSEQSDNCKLHDSPQDTSNPCSFTIATTAMHDNGVYKTLDTSKVSGNPTAAHTELLIKQRNLCISQKSNYTGSSLDRVKPSSSFISSLTSSDSSQNEFTDCETQNFFSVPFASTSGKSPSCIKNNKQNSPCSSKNKFKLNGGKLSDVTFNDPDHTKNTAKNMGQSSLSSPHNMLCNAVTRTTHSQKFVKPDNAGLHFSNHTTPTLLPKCFASPQNRVAEFILSSADFMEKCKIKDCSDSDLPAMCTSRQSLTQEPCSLNNSNSSSNTFTTCDEGFDESFHYKNISCDLREHGKIQTPVSKLIPGLKIEELKSVNAEGDLTLKLCLSKWKPPLGVRPADDNLLTSDDSFFQREHVSRAYKRKVKTTNKPPERSDAQGYWKISKSKEYPFKPSQALQHESSKVPQVPVHRKRVSDVSHISSLSVVEYLYEDDLSGITFIERHLPSECSASNESTVSGLTLDSEATDIYDWSSINNTTSASEKVTNLPLDKESLSQVNHKTPVTNDLQTEEAEKCNLQSLQNLTSEDIKQRLLKYDESCGPITSSTRQVYLRRLASLESNPGRIGLSKKVPDYPLEMCYALCGNFESKNIVELEAKLVDSFNINGRQWREGSQKSSFTYLLLDPRITRNLPLRAKDLPDSEVFKTFILATFYIGKGKRSRPYSHLYEACTKVKRESRKTSAKVTHILDIWNAGFGVVSLHCFQSVIPVEAYTREACMLEAIGLHKVTNLKKGDFYGAASTWSPQQRRQFGVYLLQKALQIFLAEGERQICVPDLKGG